VVAGLVAVHDAGIVHRDLKPGNIFLARGRNEEIEPKLLDFGISKASGKDHMRLTAANGSLMGTPFYMAPEAVQGAEMTPLSDQYALGVVLRECVTGKNPFEGSNFAEVVKLITNAHYPLLSELNPRLSKRFVAIVDRAMNVDPNNRFSDMRAMGRQLLLLAGQRTRITWGLTFGQEGRGPLPLATLERPSMPEQLPAATPPRKKRATAMLIAGVAVLSASLTSLFLTPDREEAPGGAHAQAPTVDNTRTVVMPNAPVEEPKPQGPILAPPPPQPVVESPRLNRPTSLDDDDQERDDEVAREPVRKPQRVVRPERRPQPARPAPPRRRPTPQPAPARTDDDAADWEINLASKLQGGKQNFEVGSNNAPILD